jgi:Flp pilus assembly protein TadD
MREMIQTLLRQCRPHWLPVLLLVLLTGVVYGQILGYDFLRNWDDNHYVIENADIQGFGWDRLRTIFTSYYVGNYAPAQMLSYMLDYALWGLHPGGYHLTNLLLHLFNGLMLYRLLWVLTLSRLAAWSGAALFLLHPVQVESVVWISQRKNLLALFFFLIAWECYRTYRESARVQGYYAYAASLTALLLALLSKSVAVVFPVAMLLFDHCYPGENRKTSLRDKIPYLLVSVIVAVLAVFSQTPDYSDGRGGGRTGYHGGSPLATFLTMLPVFCSYLRLVVWPFNLSALYDPVIHTGFDGGVLLALILLIGTGCLIYFLYRFDRRLAFWPLFFFLALGPVSQIVPLVTLMNDRYLYFPLIGVAGLLASGIAQAGAVRWLSSFRFMPAVAALLLFFSVLTLKRIDVWCNGITLWSDTVRKSPNVALAWEALGEAYFYNPRPNREAARKAYLRAMELSPRSDISRYNLGLLYMEQNDLEEADKTFRELLRLSPRNVMGVTAYGDLALRRFDYEEAEQRYRKALSLQPEAVQIHRKIGKLMIAMGRVDDARNSFRRIEELQGGYDASNAYDLALVEALAGDTGAAIHWLEQALSRGFSDYAAIMVDEALMPVRVDGRFGELVKKYFPR